MINEGSKTKPSEVIQSSLNDAHLDLDIISLEELKSNYAMGNTQGSPKQFKPVLMKEHPIDHKLSNLNKKLHSYFVPTVRMRTH